MAWQTRVFFVSTRLQRPAASRLSPPPHTPRRKDAADFAIGCRRANRYALCCNLPASRVCVCSAAVGWRVVERGKGSEGEAGGARSAAADRVIYESRCRRAARAREERGALLAFRTRRALASPSGPGAPSFHFRVTHAGRQDGRPNPPPRPSPPHAAAVTTPKVRGSRFSFCPRSRANPNSSCTLSHART